MASIQPTLSKKADSAMCATKKSGRSTWCLYSQQIHLPAVPALEFEVELREAIALDPFVVYYQPIISVESGRPVGAEALVRWAHPERGLLRPSELITLAENYGLIAPIGELVLHAACAQLQRLNLRACDGFSSAVNVSARHFAKPGFVAMVASAIAAYALDFTFSRGWAKIVSDETGVDRVDCRLRAGRNIEFRDGSARIGKGASWRPGSRFFRLAGAETPFWARQ
jgi:predicted signal transduction protein with EAL and GGDEF domain